MTVESGQELRVVLSQLVGRPLQVPELANALGLSRSAYYLQRDEGRLVTADNLIKLADTLGLSSVDLLVRYGLISHDAVMEYAAGATSENTPMTSRRRRRQTPRLSPRLDLPPL